MHAFIDVILHVDRHLLEFVRTYGGAVYALLFGIIFCETGLVVTPFLPGDSLLFAAGALGAAGALNLPLTFVLLALAAFSGNATNYTIGRLIGAKIITWAAGPSWGRRVIKPEYVAQAHAFFERYGGKAVVLSRFAPILRTFVPFVAGAAAMPSHRFLLFNLAGALAWVCVCLGAGFVFGNVPVVKDNFSLVTLGIVVVSILPLVIEFLRHRQRTHTTRT
jgi:membrane-associated protein